MTTFSQAVDNQLARTENSMKAFKDSSNACVDLFYKIGASRGKDILPDFIKAYTENYDYALRILQWSRDIREGAGERQIAKDILSYLETATPTVAKLLITRLPELGRWDDILINYRDKEVKDFAYDYYIKTLKIGAVALKYHNSKTISESLKNNLYDKLQNGRNAAKWAPRKGKIAAELRKHGGFTHKEYRKLLVNLTNVVETKMCAKRWEEIDFSTVPSLAASRYKKAFGRNSKSYIEYCQKLADGDTSVKVNAGAVYPYDVLKGVINNTVSEIEEQHIVAQWNALPNFMGSEQILPMVDVSGSMEAEITRNLSCMDVSISLGLYISDKVKGSFKDLILTFSEKPELIKVNGNIVQKVNQLHNSHWGYNTDLHKAFEVVLETAINSKVPEIEMPKYLLILSDMQFDSCSNHDDSAMEMIERKYTEAGYNIPKIIFWNLNSHDNAPVKFDKSGAALVSGFSPSILKSILANPGEINPFDIMLGTIMNPRYDLFNI